ncbi:MAG: nuclear transport factor 2 family protein [Actinobacteria bacterium]|nr:nuclear transport factor 2 family protein [Actinomycetota bacterium]
MTLAHQFADAFNRHDVDGLVGCFTDDATYHDLFYGRHGGHDELRKMFERMFTEGRDLVWTIDAVAGSPQLEIAEWTFDFLVSDAIPRSAGRHLHFPGVSVFELRDGRCRAYREYFDKGAALVQLGFSADSLWRTLSR